MAIAGLNGIIQFNQLFGQGVGITMWYYVLNNQRIGPVDEATMSTLIHNGTINRQISVWREGMADWLEAGQTNLKSQFTNIIPLAPPTFAGLARYPGSTVTYQSQSLRNLWLWFAWLIGLGLPLCLIIIGIIPLIAGTIIGYVLLYRYWALIQDGKARTSPGKAVGFCFIPFFNFYWFYVTFVGLSKDMNVYCEERNIAGSRVSESLALTWFILVLCQFIPYVGILFSIATIVIQIILMKQFTNVGMRIIDYRATGS